MVKHIFLNHTGIGDILIHAIYWTWLVTTTLNVELFSLLEFSGLVENRTEPKVV